MKTTRFVALLAIWRIVIILPPRCQSLSVAFS
jgi:hypothetical protein